jgi:protein TonB
MKDRSLTSSFAVSSLIHIMIVPLASMLMAGANLTLPGPIEISLVDISKVEKREEPATPALKEVVKIEKIKPPKLVQKTDIAKVDPAIPPPAVEQTPPPALTAPGPEKGSVASKASKGEAAGAEAGAGALFGEGDVAVVPGTGASVAGLGRGEKGNGFGSGGDSEGLAQLARPLGGYQVKPRYPESARRAGIQGVTLLRVRVSASGRVDEVFVEKSAGFRDLDFSAAEAVRKWLFEPARRGKEAVSVWVHLPVKFELH